jgi:membrane-associated phospholipid phosphatase
MALHFIILIVFFNCLVFSQSEESNYNSDPVSFDNEIGYMQAPQTDIQSSYVPKWHEFITNAPSNMFGAVTNSFNSGNLSALGYISALTTVLVITDAQTHSAVKSFFRNTPPLKNYGKYAVYLGDGKVEFGVGGMFALYGLAFSDNRALRTGLQCTEALISNGIMVQLLKRITGRESPLVASSKSGTWRFFPNVIKYQKDQPRYYSFPSGHLSTAIATLTVISENYPEVGFIKPVGYSIVSLLGVGLVAKDMHWFSDFPLAAAIGYEFGKVITSRNNPMEPRHVSSNDISFSFMPVFLTGGGGVNFLMSF